MKQNSFFLLLLITISNTACRKYNEPSPPQVISSTEKKWVVSTVAGNGLALFANGPALMAEFRAPLDVAVTANGTIYVADAINHRIRKIAGGQVFTFAGIGIQDTTSGVGPNAGFAFPSYLTLDATGNLYTLDVEDPRVRKITPNAFVSVVAGSGINGFADGRADISQFGKECGGIAIDAQGNLYLSDWKNRRIRKISATGHVSTIAGNGVSGFVDGNADTAQFFNPAGIVADKFGNIFIADWNRIRKVTPSGVVSTFVGTNAIGFRDGKGDAAQFTDIMDLVMDEQGNIYASDENRIRKITPQGEVSTIAGGTAGYEDGVGHVAKFNGPVGLGIDLEGNIYVADDHNNRIRKISFE